MFTSLYVDGVNWKYIPGFNNDYAISRNGEIYSFIHYKKIQPCVTKGYHMVLLRKDNEIKDFRVHRLVALTFIPNDDPENKIFINHKNENKLDNRVENLEWCTPKYNTNYESCIERRAKEKMDNFFIYNLLLATNRLRFITPFNINDGKNIAGDEYCNVKESDYITPLIYKR